MTEPGAPPPDHDAGDEPGGTPDADAGDEAGATPDHDELGSSSELDRALGRLKRDGGDADDSSVSSDARTRMSWSSVTEAEPDEDRTADASTPDPPPPTESSFRFDLGSALERLGGRAPQSEPSAAPPSSAPAPESDAPAPPTPGSTEPPPSPTPGADATSPPATSTPAPPAPAPPASGSGPVPPPPAAAEPPLPSRSAPPAEPTTPPAAAAPPVTPPADPTDEALPRRGAPAPMPADQLPRRRSSAPPPADDLPQRRSPTPVEGSPRRRGAEPTTPAADLAPSPDRSVFDTANPAPSLPRNPQRSPSSEPMAPDLPAATTAALPTLPAANPAAPTRVVDEPATQTGPDVHAVRSFELKAQRERRHSRFVGFSFMAFILLAAVVGVGLLFGRGWLFPTQWSEDLIPLVDEIQLANGAEFSEPVPLEELSAGEYAAVALEATFGDDWSAAFPQWRALGLASGAVDSPAIVDAVVAWRSAVYDADRGVIYRVADSADTASGDTATEGPADTATEGPADTATEGPADAAIRLALLQAFEDQRGISPPDVEGAGGITGVSSSREIAARAVDRALLIGSTDVPTADADAQVPLPLLYEMIAVDVFGEPILDAVDADPAPLYGDEYPDEILDALAGDDPLATLGALPDGAEPIGEPVALGSDAWALVWQNRLPDPTTVRLVSLITADAYQPFVQGGKGCVAAAFETASDINAGEVVTALTAWAVASPIEASPSISISTADPARVEFITCDPGAAAEQSVAPSTIVGLVEQQLDALG